MPSIDSVTFDIPGMTPVSRTDNLQISRTSDGDGVTLEFFDKPPGVPKDLRSASELRDIYVPMLAGKGMMLVETGVTVAAGRRVLRTILKVPQQPHGMTYIGAVVILFRDFSFAVKVQCAEHGRTGFREAMLLDRALDKGTVSFDPAIGIVGAWSPDDEQHDAAFPAHPLSHLRRALRSIESTLAIDPATAAEAPFHLPEPAPVTAEPPPPMKHFKATAQPRKRWWQFWKR